MIARCSLIIPRQQRIPPVLRPRGSRSSSISVIIITDRPPYMYTAVDGRRRSFSGCSAPSILSLFRVRVWNELSRVHRPLLPVFWQSSQDSPFRPFLSGSRLKTHLFGRSFLAVVSRLTFSAVPFWQSSQESPFRPFLSGSRLKTHLFGRSFLQCLRSDLCRYRTL